MIELGIRKPITVLMLVLGIILFAVVTFSRLPVELYPNTESGEISVITRLRGGIAATEVEKYVTKPLEESFSEINGLKEMISSSRESESNIQLQFHHGVDTNFDLTESMLCSSFDWNGFRAPMIVATENDAKNGIGMIVASLLSGGAAQLFADIRTNWTPASIKKATGVNVSRICPNGIIDKRNSGAGALDYAADPFRLVPGGRKLGIQELNSAIRASHKAQEALIAAACAGTRYMAANLEYFLGDGLSSHYRTPGNIPLTAYRYNVIGDQLTCSVVEGATVELPVKVADLISARTDPTWPETYWTPRGMSSFEYMSRIGPNHDANSFGLIGADLLTFNAMLRIPVDMHNIAAADIFRPTMWDRFGNDDFRVCQRLGPLYV